MELDASLSWLALALTPGLASRLSARLLREFGSPEEVFRAPLTRLEACRLPAPVAQAVFKKQSFKRAEKELALTRSIDRCRLVITQESFLMIEGRVQNVDNVVLIKAQRIEPLPRHRLVGAESHDFH